MFLIAIIVLSIVSTVDVSGQNNRRRITKPETRIFLEGGNDSWNNRQKPGKKRKAVQKVQRQRTTSQTNLLPYIEQQNINKKPVVNGQNQTNGLRTRKKYANQETGYRKKRNRK